MGADDDQQQAGAPLIPAPEWWRTAVIYQIYPRSFADSSGDGIGDLAGVADRLGELADLGVDAIWLSPFMPSPQKDAGYDVADYRDVDPLFGTLDDFDAMLRQAHRRAIRVIIDLVPNHSSDQHPWFQEALRSAPGSRQRARYIFREGQGPDGDLPPNNWQSIFGGPAWSRITEPDGAPGQWYLHLFDSSQPDFDWSDAEVQEEFRGILRFWLDRGVDGFRVDVAHGLVKDQDLPDYTPDPHAASMGGQEHPAPYFEQPGVHQIYRDWRNVLQEYDGDRALCAEAWVSTVEKIALWVRPDEMHQAFNFTYLETPWDAAAQREVIEASLQAFGAVGAPSTWVLSNHDVIRHATRLALESPSPQGDGIDASSPGLPTYAAGLRRARAASALMLALPGSAYIYQGEELGLPEVLDIRPEDRQDPTWFRTGGQKVGRDGCRVPIPWTPTGPSYGFSAGGQSWLPQPQQWAELARQAQKPDADSTLNLYRRLLRLRREHRLGVGEVHWLDGYPETAVALRNGEITVIANVGTEPLHLPERGTVVVSSATLAGAELPPDTTAWLL